MNRFSTLFALAAILVSSAVSVSASADEGDRSFLLCEGVSGLHQGLTASFTVTLDANAAKVLDMGTGAGPGVTTVAFTDTEIAAKQVVGAGVENALQIDRASGAFAFNIIHTVKAGEAPADTDDAFSGTCKPTGKAF